MINTKFEVVDLSLPKHRSGVIKLLNDYMMDDMGSNKPFHADLHHKVLSDLNDHTSYMGFLLKVNETYVALANCFVNYSTFQAKHLINIHDYIVSTEERGNGYGRELLNRIIKYSKEKGYCRISLEVREDNVKALSLYKSLDFKQCQPNMYFWERNL